MIKGNVCPDALGDGIWLAFAQLNAFAKGCAKANGRRKNGNAKETDNSGDGKGVGKTSFAGTFNWCGREGRKSNGCEDETTCFRERSWMSNLQKFEGGNAKS